jgi:prephenate dehydrogenase
MLIRRLAIIGLGLIGGSLAKAARMANVVETIVGFDADRMQIQRALQDRVIDVSADSAADAARGADVVLIAVPVLATANALHAAKPGIGVDSIITDVGSTKQSVLAAAQEVFGTVLPKFVAAHPIAGTEKSGVANALPDLFRGHRVILTPHAQQDVAAQTLIAKLWEAVGARVVTMEPARHDAIFAATSHLPHLLAFAFVDMLSRLEGADVDIFPNAGGGFRDFTRIASSSPRMWHDIVRANSTQIAALLQRQIDELQRLHQLIERGEWQQLGEVFEHARAVRERHLARIE